ncbi:addiction module toxin RelE [Tardiphaga alba]|uniref:Addiction module toxin RelE n=1 Tax=Tardiphaga alba TaxID=340268 RepID=A0ABX8A7G4_9BRAD|nr:type II toxin-antitoxin system RelE/ParE family toxin [Tardiphaga alba]QUS39683.1 addiction module toxin RelE [Tardiphaga alba]
MSWNVEYTDEFARDFWSTLSESAQDDVTASVMLLAERGPKLPFPYSSGIGGSRHTHMRELRVQSGGRPLRIFYAFDPRRSAILLIGGDKTGKDRFYAEMLPVADKLYDVHLQELKKEGSI